LIERRRRGLEHRRFCGRRFCYSPGADHPSAGYGSGRHGARPASDAPTPAAAFHRIGPDDVLRVNVYGHPDLTQSVVVGTDSHRLSLLGRVSAGGWSRELEQADPALGDGFIREPT
jgi:hypothetical protein